MSVLLCCFAEHYLPHVGGLLAAEVEADSQADVRIQLRDMAYDDDLLCDKSRGAAGPVGGKPTSDSEPTM